MCWYSEIEDALLEWPSGNTSGPILHEKANDFGKLFNKQNFEWEQIYGIHFFENDNTIFGKICGESESILGSVTKNCSNFEDNICNNDNRQGKVIIFLFNAKWNPWIYRWEMSWGSALKM